MLEAEQDRVRLGYSASAHGGERESIHENIPLDRVLCRFGGTRPYFMCPGIVSGVACGRRVAKLYAGGRYFLCRHCYRLTYESQKERGYHRALRRASMVRSHLGGEPGPRYALPERPKGMWQKTYEKQLRRIRMAEIEADEHLEVIAAQLMARMLDRYDGGRRKDFWR